MGIAERIGRTLKSGTERLLSRLEDPAENIELARRRQREALAETRRRLEDVRSELAAIAVDARYAASVAGQDRARSLVLEEENLAAAEQRLQDRITEFDALAARLAAENAAEAARRAADDFPG